MSTSLYIQCALMYILGQGFDLFLIKVPEYRDLYRKANEKFSWSKYWDSDWNIVIGTLILGSILIIGADQLIYWKPGVLEYVKWFFAAIGGLGSSFIASKWSRCKKYITAVIDEKTNIADNKTNDG